MLALHASSRMPARLRQSSGLCRGVRRTDWRFRVFLIRNRKPMEFGGVRESSRGIRKPTSIRRPTAPGGSSRGVRSIVSACRDCLSEGWR